jgi:capsular polysaccharide biosynthesis protein
MSQKKKIIASLPANLKQEHKLFFKDKTKYEVKIPQIKRLKNVFVSEQGLCLRNLILVPKSTFNMSGSDDHTFYWKYYWLVMEQYLVANLGKSLNLQTLRGQTYLLVHTKWFNYFFWVTSSLIRLIKTRDLHKELTLIYPISWEQYAFVNDSLKMFPDLKKILIPEGEHMKVGKLLLPEVRQTSIGIIPKDAQYIRNFVYHYLDEAKINVDKGAKIYITREKNGKRVFVNEAEVQAFLVERGFEVLAFEDYSFFEQASIMRNAQQVVSIHGAGLANISFMNESEAILELIKIIQSKNDARYSFWRLCAALNVRYFIQFCEPEKRDDIDLLVNLNLIADMKLLEENLNLIAN